MKIIFVAELNETVKFYVQIDMREFRQPEPIFPMVAVGSELNAMILCEVRRRISTLPMTVLVTGTSAANDFLPIMRTKSTDICSSIQGQVRKLAIAVTLVRLSRP